MNYSRLTRRLLDNNTNFFPIEKTSIQKNYFDMKKILMKNKFLREKTFFDKNQKKKFDTKRKI